VGVEWFIGVRRGGAAGVPRAAVSAVLPPTRARAPRRTRQRCRGRCFLPPACGSSLGSALGPGRRRERGGALEQAGVRAGRCRLGAGGGRRRAVFLNHLPQPLGEVEISSHREESLGRGKSIGARPGVTARWGPRLSLCHHLPRGW